MYNARKTLIFLFLMGFLIISCTGQNPSESTPDVNAILTAGVGTFAAALFQTQTAMVPPATATPTITPTPTATVASPIPLLSPTASATFAFFATTFPTASITPTGTQYTPTANPNTLAYGCNNLLLIADVNVPAGTVFKPEENFTKTWQVANTGTCDWVYFYHLVFISGDDIGGRETGRLGKVIPPGKWTQLSVNLRAPKAPGNYVGYWRFADQSGNAFGSTLGVSFEVKANQPPPTDTATPAPPTATATPTNTP